MILFPLKFTELGLVSPVTVLEIGVGLAHHGGVLSQLGNLRVRYLDNPKALNRQNQSRKAKKVAENSHVGQDVHRSDLSCNVMRSEIRY